MTPGSTFTFTALLVDSVKQVCSPTLPTSNSVSIVTLKIALGDRSPILNFVEGDIEVNVD